MTATPTPLSPELRAEIARAMSTEIARQDDEDAHFLDADLKAAWLDQGEVDFGLVADALAPIIARIEAAAVEREREAYRDALKAAYTEGATAVHEYWAAGNTAREADFGEAASDYADSIANAR